MANECSFLALAGVLFRAMSSPDNGVKCYTCENCIINNEAEPLSVLNKDHSGMCAWWPLALLRVRRHQKSLEDHVVNHINIKNIRIGLLVLNNK